MEHYRVLEEIGGGEHSIVYKGRRKRSVMYYAFKSIDKSRREKVLHEVKLVHSMSHPNILKFQAWYETSNHIWVITELASGLTLRDLLLADGPLPIESALKLSLDMIAALSYLHSSGIIYGSLRPSRVLLSPAGTVKLGDFALAHRFDSAFPSANGSPSPSYMAPELFFPGGVHSPASDLWSLGILMYELVAGQPPWAGATTIDELVHAVVSTPQPALPSSSMIPAEYSKVIDGLLIKNPADRMSWTQLANSSIWSVPFTPPTLPPHHAWSSMLSQLPDSALASLRLDPPVQNVEPSNVQGQASKLPPPSSSSSSAPTNAHASALTSPSASQQHLKPSHISTPSSSAHPSLPPASAVSSKQHVRIPTSTRNSHKPSTRSHRPSRSHPHSRPARPSSSSGLPQLFMPPDLTVSPLLFDPRVENYTGPPSKLSIVAQQAGFEVMPAIQVIALPQADLQAWADQLRSILENQTSLISHKLLASQYMLDVLRSETSLADAFIAGPLPPAIIKLMRSTRSAPLKTALVTLLAQLFHNSGEIPPSLEASGLWPALLDTLRDRSVSVRARGFAAVGELLYFLSMDEPSDSNPAQGGSEKSPWSVPDAVFKLIERAIVIDSGKMQTLAVDTPAGAASPRTPRGAGSRTPRGSGPRTPRGGPSSGHSGKNSPRGSSSTEEMSPSSGDDLRESHVMLYAALAVHIVSRKSSGVSRRMATFDLVFALVGAFDLTRNDDARVILASAVARLVRISPSLGGKIIEKKGLRWLLDQLAESQVRVLIPWVNVLNTTLDHGGSGRRLLSALRSEPAVLPAMLSNMESTYIMLRSKTLITLTLLLRDDPLAWFCAIFGSARSWTQVMSRAARDRQDHARLAWIAARDALVEAGRAVVEATNAELERIRTRPRTTVPGSGTKFPWSAVTGLVSLAQLPALNSSPAVGEVLVPAVAHWAGAAGGWGAASVPDTWRQSVIRIVDALVSSEAVLIHHTAQIAGPLLRGVATLLRPTISAVDVPDIRFYALKIIHDTVSWLVARPGHYSPGGESARPTPTPASPTPSEGGSSSSLPNPSPTDVTRLVDETLVKHVLPATQALLSDPSPIPLYASKLVASVIAANPAYAGIIYRLRLVPAFLEAAGAGGEAQPGSGPAMSVLAGLAQSPDVPPEIVAKDAAEAVVSSLQNASQGGSWMSQPTVAPTLLGPAMHLSLALLERPAVAKMAGPVLAGSIRGSLMRLVAAGPSESTAAQSVEQIEGVTAVLEALQGW